MSAAVLNLSGYLSKDIDVQYLPSGKPVAKSSIAVNKGKDDKKTVTWYNIVIFGIRAENHAFLALLKKGTGVFVSGELDIRQFTRQDGTQGTSNDVTVSTLDIVKFIDQSQGGAQEEPTEENPF